MGMKNDLHRKGNDFSNGASGIINAYLGAEVLNGRITSLPNPGMPGQSLTILPSIFSTQGTSCQMVWDERDLLGPRVTLRFSLQEYSLECLTLQLGRP